MYSENLEKIITFANRKLKSYHRSEELAQEVFLTACERIDDFRASPNPAGWLLNTTKNKINHELRTRQVVIQYFESEYIENFRGAYVEITEEYDIASILTEEELDMLKSTCLDGFTSAEVADRYGISPAACRKRISRAKEKVVRLLKD